MGDHTDACVARWFAPIVARNEEEGRAKHDKPAYHEVILSEPG